MMSSLYFLPRLLVLREEPDLEDDDLPGADDVEPLDELLPYEDDLLRLDVDVELGRREVVRVRTEGAGLVEDFLVYVPDLPLPDFEGAVLIRPKELERVVLEYVPVVFLLD